MNIQLLKLSAVAAGAILMSACGNPESGTTQCTTEPAENWLDQDQFRQTLQDDGYKINEFKVTDGNCYEIYGFDENEQKVEIYFNPVNGHVIKEEIE